MSNHHDIASLHRNGDIIPQEWSPVFVVYAFITCCMASYSAVRLLDHTHWRSEKEKQHASEIIIRFPQFISSFLLGFGIWSTHFIGISAVSLKGIASCYNWPITVGSLLAVVVLVWAGFKIAERDYFRGPNRLELLKQIALAHPDVTRKGRHKQASHQLYKLAFFSRIYYIILGAMIAALGALVMHYSGMVAISGPFRKQFSPYYVGASVVLGVTVCLIGFWILFRLLLWKVAEFWLRPVSAVIIAAAVCLLHFFGMLSITYVYDDSAHHHCGSGSNYADNKWTPHQIVDVSVSIVVPALALLVETLISREVFNAYCKLKNPELTVDFILKAAARSRDPELREFASAAISYDSDGLPRGSLDSLEDTPLCTCECHNYHSQEQKQQQPRVSLYTRRRASYQRSQSFAHHKILMLEKRSSQSREDRSSDLESIDELIADVASSFQIIDTEEGSSSFDRSCLTSMDHHDHPEDDDEEEPSTTMMMMMMEDNDDDAEDDDESPRFH